MTIREIYTRFSLMPQLVEHSLRVTAVADLVVQGWSDKSVDRLMVVETCLLHDLGNLVKFKLNIDLPGTPPLSADDRAKWLAIQTDQIQRYSSNAHTTTLAMCREIGAESIATILQEENDLYYSKPTITLLERASAAALLLMYADLRVMPHGVSTIEERLVDLETRYRTPPENHSWIRDFVGYIASHTTTDLSSITEANIQTFMKSYLDQPLLAVE